MEIGKTLWEQKANSNSNTLFNFGIFVYEFVSSKITLVAFVALLSIVTVDFKYYGEVLSMALAVFLFFFISETFKVFWTGVNLKYLITNNGIAFDWGVSQHHELFIPYEDIDEILIANNKKRTAVIFKNSQAITNKDYGFSKEVFSTDLSFEGLEDLDKVIAVLNQNYLGNIVPLYKIESNHTIDALPDTTLYLKFVQLLAFVLLFISTNIALKIIDNNFLESKQYSDKVVNVSYHVDSIYGDCSTIETAQGYSITINDYFEKDREVVNYGLSPIYEDLTSLGPKILEGPDSLMNGYLGFYLYMKVIAFVVLFLSACYLFYRRGKIPFQDLSLFLFFPLFTLIIVFYVFNF